MKSKIIIIHGNSGGTGDSAWIPWLAEKLTKQGFEVHNPTFPDNEEAKSSIWLPFIDELGADQNTILVGWSSGAVAAMRYAENHKIKASILIGACYTDLGEEIERISGYYEKPWQWDAIRANQEWIVQFGSVDDPVIPIEESRFVHQRLNSEYHEFADKKHFGWPTPMPVFPEALEAILKHED